MFIGTASFDYDTMSTKWIIIFCIKFLQTIKCCCQVHIQAKSLLKRNKHQNAFRVWLCEKQLGLLRVILHSPGCCWHVRSLLFLFYVYMSRGMTRLLDISKRNGRTKIDINTSGSLSRRKLQMRMYQFKLTKS